MANKKKEDTGIHIDPTEEAVEVEQTDALNGIEGDEPTIADRLEDIPVAKLSNEEIAELEKLKQEIVYVSVDDIKPSSNKARKNDSAVPKVANSIRQLGFRSPIYVDAQTDKIVIGHTRWAAAKKLGLTRVPVVYVFDLSPSKLKLLKLADNRVAEFSGWDFDELNKELEELKLELPELELDELGFGSDTAGEIDDLFDQEQKEVGEKSKDKEPKMYTCPECGHTFEVED